MRSNRSLCLFIGECDDGINRRAGGDSFCVCVFVCFLVCLVCTVHALRTLPTGLAYKIKLSLCKKESFERESIYAIPFVLANDNRN
jgi:hypothetical protein